MIHRKLYLPHYLNRPYKDGVQYLMKNTTMMLVDLSGHGTKVGASIVLLTYILSQFKAAHLWEKLTEETPSPKESRRLNGMDQFDEPKASSKKGVDLFSQVQIRASPLNDSALYNALLKETEDDTDTDEGDKGAVALPTSKAGRPSTPKILGSPLSVPLKRGHNGQFHLQFSVNGMLKPVVVIQVNFQDAPIVSSFNIL